jgi:hypothetical protein
MAVGPRAGIRQDFPRPVSGRRGAYLAPKSSIDRTSGSEAIQGRPAYDRHGLRMPAVALMGSSLGDAQVAHLRDCPALRFVTVMLDSDEAGQKAGDNIAAQLAKHW